MSGSPLYESIFNEYKEKIISGELSPGTKLPTEMEIADQYDVSRITATRALRELEQNRFIHRIKGSGSYVNQEDQWVAMGTDSPGSNSLAIISLVLPFEGNFSADIFRGIEDVAKEKDYLVTFHNSSDDPATEKRIIEELTAKGIHGTILYPVDNSPNMDLYSSLLIEKYPFVLIDRKIHGLDLPLVWTDNEKGFYEVTKHLIELGHKKIAFAGTSVFSISSELLRYNGFCRAHIDHGIPLLKKHLFYSETIEDIPADYRPDENLETRICHYFLDMLESLDEAEKPTAIAAVNDQVAEIIIRTAIKRGISIPGDYSLTGFDDLPYSSHLPVPLTTVSQPVYDIGRLAAEELFKRIDFPGRKASVQTLDSSLVVRESTSPLKK